MQRRAAAECNARASEGASGTAATKASSGPQEAVFDAEARELAGAIAREVTDLTPQELTWMSPQVLGIFVKARLTLETRIPILRDTLLWRSANRELLGCLTCRRCSENPQSHDARCFGVDPEGDLVFMNCFALAQDTAPSGIEEHMVCLFERALRAYPAAKQWTWIIDMHGFGVGHLDPRTSIALLRLVQVAYRGRLKRCVVLDAPLMFGGLWTVVKPFIASNTAEAIFFDTWPDCRDELLKVLGAPLASRMLSEMEENRDPERAQQKVWTTFWATPVQTPECVG